MVKRKIYDLSWSQNLFNRGNWNPSIFRLAGQFMSAIKNKLFLWEKKSFWVQKLKTEVLNFSNLSPNLKLTDKFYQ